MNVWNQDSMIYQDISKFIFSLLHRQSLILYGFVELAHLPYMTRILWLNIIHGIYTHATTSSIIYSLTCLLFGVNEKSFKFLGFMSDGKNSSVIYAGHKYVCNKLKLMYSDFLSYRFGRIEA